MDISKFTPEERASIVDEMQHAVFHLLSCWQHLSAIETQLENAVEVETDDMDGLTFAPLEPSDSFKIPEADIMAVIEGLEVINA